MYEIHLCNFHTNVIMKIAVLVTEYLKSYIEETIMSLSLDCKTDVFIFYNLKHIVELYKFIKNDYDGFITTGPIPMQVILNSEEDCKPISYFKCSDTNYYKTFFEVIYRYNDWNFEYGYFDCCDYLHTDKEAEIVKYLREGTFDEWLKENDEYISNMSIDEMENSTEQKLNKHISLWKSGKIKYSLSRMSTIMPQILEAGVNCYFIPFSCEDILIGFHMLINRILDTTLRENQPATIDISLKIAKSNSTNFSDFLCNYNLLEKIIRSFDKKYICNFIIRNTKSGFRIFTNYKTIERITNSFTTCILSQYIKKHGISNINIGYGLGKDLNFSEANAIKANKESNSNIEKSSYLITSSGDQIGLYGDTNAIEIKQDVTPYIQEISSLTGLSILSVQKLFTALKIMDNNEVTSSDLSRVLHISTRSVNRILSKLVNCNLAEILYTKPSITKGRPQTVYKILLSYK